MKIENTYSNCFFFRKFPWFPLPRYIENVKILQTFHFLLNYFSILLYLLNADSLFPRGVAYWSRSPADLSPTPLHGGVNLSLCNSDPFYVSDNKYRGVYLFCTSVYYFCNLFPLRVRKQHLIVACTAAACELPKKRCGEWSSSTPSYITL